MAVRADRFRPMTFTDVLDETFDLFKRNLVVLIGISAVFNIPINILQGAVANPILARIQSGGGDVDQTSSLFLRYLIAQAPISVLALIGYCLVTGAVSYAVSTSYLGGSPTIGTSYGAVFRRFWALAWTLLLSALIVFGPFVAVCVIGGTMMVVGSAMIGSAAGIVLSIIGGLVVIASVVFMVVASIRYSFVVPAVVVEGRGYWDALKRSWGLISGFAGKVVGVSLVVAVVISVITGVIAAAVAQVLGMFMPAQSIASSTIAGSINGVCSAVLSPIQSIVVVLLYYDLRIRKEGFDLQMLARDLSTPDVDAVGDPVEAGVESPKR